MPRRKITLEEAFKVIESHGLDVEVKAVKVESLPQKPKIDIFKNSPSSEVKVKVEAKTATIALFAKHSVSSGGHLVVGLDGKQIESAGGETYGPGVCTVPTELVQYLLYQDNLAKECDARMLEKTQRSYLIVERRTRDGIRSSIGMPVPTEVIDGGLGNLPLSDYYVIG